MTQSHIIFEVSDHIGKVTLNRPDLKNALSPDLMAELGAVIKTVSEDKQIRVLIITGAGDAFSGGGDVNRLLEDRKKSSSEIREFLKKLYGGGALSLRTLEIPVIGAINGAAVGAGFELLLHCDFRIAADTAKMGPIWARISTIPALGGMFLLPRIVGLGRATQMMMLGEVIDAAEAYRIGLVNSVVPKNDLESASLDLARRLARGASAAISIIKNGINRGLDGTLMNEIDYAIYMQSICMKMEDCEEGIRAFKEKRKPQFKGR